MALIAGDTGKIQEGERLDLLTIGHILNDLRLANEVEAAAEMDVDDAQANLTFYERKLAATKERLEETKAATQEVCDRLAVAVTEATYPPLMLTCAMEARDAAS